MVQILAGPNGSRVFFEPSGALPLVHVSVSLRSGSAFDPEGQEGLARLATRLLRMGTRRMPAEALEDRIDSLGAQLGVATGSGYTHVAGSVVARNAEAFIALLAEVLQAPAFRGKDLSQQKRETQAALVGALDDDSWLAGRAFRTTAVPGHPSARITSGNRASLRRIARADVLAHHERHWVGRNVLIGITGPLATAQVEDLVSRHFSWLPKGARPRRRVPAPRFPKGRRMLVVDKPGRVQTQVLIGTLGTDNHDADHVDLTVANTAFGGLFTSRLTTEVRAKRGWSYGASSGFGQQKERDLWSMRTAPANEDAAACIGLQLDLLARWASAPLTHRELRAAKQYLVQSAPFEVDTASKRLDLAVDQALFDLPEDHRAQFVPKVRRVTRDSALAAVRKRISTRNQLIVVVGTAKALESDLRAVPDLADFRVIPHDALI